MVAVVVTCGGREEGREMEKEIKGNGGIHIPYKYTIYRTLVGNFRTPNSKTFFTST